MNFKPFHAMIISMVFTIIVACALILHVSLAYEPKIEPVVPKEDLNTQMLIKSLRKQQLVLELSISGIFEGSEEYQSALTEWEKHNNLNN